MELCDWCRENFNHEKFARVFFLFLPMCFLNIFYIIVAAIATKEKKQFTNVVLHWFVHVNKTAINSKKYIEMWFWLCDCCCVINTYFA